MINTLGGDGIEWTVKSITTVLDNWLDVLTHHLVDYNTNQKHKAEECCVSHGIRVWPREATSNT